MPDFPLYRGGSRIEDAGADAAASSGTTITTGAADTKGSYVQLIASTSFNAFGFWGYFGGDGSGSDKRQFMIDLAVGAAASEQDVVSNFILGSDVPKVNHAFFPLFIPAGSRIAARAQSPNATVALDISLTLIGKPISMGQFLHRMTAYGANTADSSGVQIDPGGVANTKGGYSQIDASIANPIKALMIGFSLGDNTAGIDSSFLFDVAVGAAASEQIIIADIHVGQDQNTDCVSPSITGPFPVNIPAGSRLAVQSQSTTTDATDRLLDVALYGLD